MLARLSSESHARSSRAVQISVCPEMVQSTLSSRSLPLAAALSRPPLAASLSRLPLAAAALVWLLAAPLGAFAQTGGGGHAGSSGHSGGGHPSGGKPSSAPASAPASGPAAAPAHAAAPAPGSHPASGTAAQNSARGAAGDRAAEADVNAETSVVPHVVMGSYGYFDPRSEPRPQRFAASNYIWQDPPRRVTIPPPTAESAHTHMLQGAGAIPRYVLPPITNPTAIPFAANNLGNRAFSDRRFRGRGGFNCFDLAINPFCYSGGFGFGYGLGFGFGYGYGLGYGYFGGDFGYYNGGYDINPADFNAQDEAAPEPYIGNFLYEGSEEATELEAATAPGPLTVIYFGDGSSYAVKDYWLDNGQLHYVTSYGGENSVAVGRVDLQRTVDENAKNGVGFTLRPANP